MRVVSEWVGCQNSLTDAHFKVASKHKFKCQVLHKLPSLLISHLLWSLWVYFSFNNPFQHGLSIRGCVSVRSQIVGSWMFPLKLINNSIEIHVCCSLDNPGTHSSSIQITFKTYLDANKKFNCSISIFIFKFQKTH